MAATIFYTITSGATPITVELTPSFIPVNTHLSPGTYSFTDVDNGEYTLIFTDSNGCVYEKDVIVDPFVTTTTTTVIPGDALIAGQAQDVLLIFNQAGTNRTNHYLGNTPSDTNLTLYLWFKTLDGEPLTTNKSVAYSIFANGSLLNPATTGSTIRSGYTASFSNNTYRNMTGLTATGMSGSYSTGYVLIDNSNYSGVSYSFTTTTYTASTSSGTVYEIPTTFSGSSYVPGSKFTYLDVSDQVHTEVNQTMTGPSKTIAGVISFKTGFIETYFKYGYQKDLILPDFQINMDSWSQWLDPNISLTGGTKHYGVVYVDRDNIILKY